MHFHSFILAKDDESLIKVAFWIIIGVIWVISSIVSSIKKKMNEMPKRRDISEISIELTPTMEVRSAQEMRASQMRSPQMRSPQMRSPQRRPPQMASARLGQPLIPMRAAPLRPVSLGPPPLQVRSVPPNQKGKSQKRQPPAQAAPAAPPALYTQKIAAQDQPPAIGTLQPLSTAPSAARESAASQLAKALHRPGALRTQIVIAEIFGKPLALREVDRLNSI